MRPGHPHSFPAPSSARIRQKPGAAAQPATAQPPRCRRSPHTEAPTEIPLEAVTEALEIMEGLLGPGDPAQGLPGGERGEDSSKPPQGEEGVYPDPGLLTYMNELCAQGDFLNKVGWPWPGCYRISGSGTPTTQAGVVPMQLVLLFLIPELWGVCVCVMVDVHM